MTEPVFVDSNVFLYAVDEADRLKQKVARKWRTALWTSRLGRTSFQVLGEFYVNALRLRPGAINIAREEIRDLLAWRPVSTDLSLLEEGWKIQDRYHLSYWTRSSWRLPKPHLAVTFLQKICRQVRIWMELRL